MAASSALVSSSSSLSSLLPSRTVALHAFRHHQQLFLFPNSHPKSYGASFRVQAVKPPAGVEMPKVEPQFKAPFLGFTKTAEIWNSRACMIGIIGVFILELILNKGILQVIGVDIGKGLDIPL